MATEIDSVDFNRYEVIKTRPMNTEATNVAITNQPITVTTDPGTGTKPTSLDAFGRMRMSSPLTLFDSAHRFRDNNLWETNTASGGAATFNCNQGLMDLSVTTTSGSLVYRETKRVFAYQSGKSLLVMSTFVFNPGKTNLRQRCGYFSTANGYYVQLNGSTLSLVERTSISGSPVETVVNQSGWSVDKLDGTGPSGYTIDPTKSQILWLDMEWLGVGTVRMGFVIEGKFVLCHQFHHANVVPSTYITTACLPLRYEIENTGATASSSTMKQICSTVLSEGGYEVRGAQQAISIPVTAPIALATAGTYYPIISIRLTSSPNYLDAIAILASLSLLAKGNNYIYSWQIRKYGTTTGGTWVAVPNSSISYNITGTSFSGGTVLSSGYVQSTTQSAAPINQLDGALFKFQLERNSFTSTPYELTLVAASDTLNGSLLASVDFEEITR